jgi:DNA repair exonuclease SbcCD nuclease subunit
MQAKAILHLADLHLGAPPPAKLREIAPDLADRFAASRDQLLVRLARWITTPPSPVGLVLVAGDLFDHHAPPPELVDAVNRAIATIQAAGIPVITVPGNHDEYSYPQGVFRQRKWAGPLVTNPKVEEVYRLPAGELFTRPVAVFSACYQAGQATPGQLVDLPSAPEDCISVVLLHATLADHGYLPSELVEKERTFRVLLEAAAQSGYHYLALGHIHQFVQWQKGPTIAVYPGPPVGPIPQDAGTGQLVLLTEGQAPASAGARVQVKPVSPPEVLGLRWKLIRENVSPADRPEHVVGRVQQQMVLREDEIAVLMLRGTAHSENFVADCQALFLSRGLSVLVLGDRLSEVPPVDVELLAQEQSLIGEWVRQWQKWKEEEKPAPALAELVLREAMSCFRWA